MGGGYWVLGYMVGLLGGQSVASMGSECYWLAHARGVRPTEQDN